MPEPVLAVERFTYSYPSSAVPALDDVSLSLDPGSFTVVTGASGCGKSTLLRAACGLVPHFHGGEVSGELFAGGMSVRQHGPSDLAEVCGTLLQDPETQVVMNGVRAEIALALEHRGEPQGAVARAVEEASLALGVGHLLDRGVDTLSGGELQRVALAGAIAHRPRLLLLDEPASQLDPVAGDELVSLLRRLNEEWDVAVLVAEHRLERCLAGADRVVALDRGRVACDAAPPEFLAWAAAEDRDDLLTPAARLFKQAGMGPLPASVKQARVLLRGAGLAPAAGGPADDYSGDDAPASARRPMRARLRPRWRSRSAGHAALSLHGVWLELEDGGAILRGVDFAIAPGERVALMGRNGAGKSTLLRVARGLVEPTRGDVRRAGEVALLLQNPGDYLIHERAGDETDAAGLAAAGLEGRASANPRDLSGGERQRLALEVALGTSAPAAVLLDEPTRGMDWPRRRALAERLRALAVAGAGVVVATHDSGFAAEVADRVVLMGQGVVIADGPAAEVLVGGWHFATEVARVLDGAGGALTPEEGALVIERELVG